MKLVYIVRNCTLLGGQSRIAWEVALEALRAGHEIHLVARRFPSPMDPAVIPHKVFQLPWFFGDFRFRSFAHFSSGAAAALDGADTVLHGFGDSYSQDIITLGNVDWNHPQYIPGRVPERAAVHIKRESFLDPKLKILVAVSQQMARDILDLVPGFDKKKIRVIYPGVNVASYSPANREKARRWVTEAHGVPGDKTWIVTAAGGDFIKRNVATLAKALLRLNGRTDWRFLCVGAEAGLFPWPREIMGRSHFLGRLKDISAVLPGADLLAYPAWFDEFALVCLESMASGLPLVLTKTVGISEILCPANAPGLLDKADDDAALAASIGRFLDDGDLRRKAGAGNAAEAAKHSWPETHKQYAALYAEIAAAKRTVPAR